MKIVVVGGGNAGYVSALYLQKTIKNAEVTIIDSSRIGAIGVGEGTNPNFFYLLKKIDVDIDKSLVNAEATVKNGIKFTGWANNNKYYWLHIYDPVDFKKSIKNFIKTNLLLKNKYKSHLDFKVKIHKEFSKAASYAVLKDGNLNKINPFSYLSDNYKFNKAHHSLHFDAQKMLLFLRSIAIKRNIKIIDDEFKDCVFDTNGDIKELIFLNNKLDCDFVIDCTGSNRLLIGKKFNSDWNNLSNSLPCDSAIAFWIKEDKIKLYTESIAMDYGWAWKAPVQDRYGCGYVYDSSFISESDAIKEIKNKFGNDVDIKKKIKFDSGYFYTPLRNNCLALGLSSGFFEPLEATSLSILSQMLETITDKNFIDIFYNRSKNKEDDFNSIFCNINEEVHSFIYLHYITNKTNTVFWKDFIQKNTMPPKLKKFLQDMKDNLFSDVFGNSANSVFAYPSWLAVYLGNELYDYKLLHSLVDSESILMYTDIVQKNDEVINSSISFDKYLNKITNKGENT